jgi:phosphatidylserine decarboxylase
MQTLKEFLADSKTKKIERANPQQLHDYDFNRDPNRPIYVDPSVFYSPADGFILYSKVVKPDEDIIDVKGVSYTINALMQEEVKAKECLIIGIFLTALDVHVCRIPTDGFIQHEKIDALKCANLSMRPVEKKILDELEIDHNDMTYALYNERVRNRIFFPAIDQPYYLIQIADFEVDIIAHFGHQGDFFTQGERFSVIRMGSQVDLIIPFTNPKVTFKSLVNDKLMAHVEAGLDPLVEWSRK